VLIFSYNHAFVSEAQYNAATADCASNFVNNTNTECLAAITNATNNVLNINVKSDRYKKVIFSLIMFTSLALLLRRSDLIH
jgi:hypothetical protein